MTVYWSCLHCTLVGDTDRSADQHTRKTGHTTITGTDPQLLARAVEKVGRL